jgi:hypothetical protein
LPYELRALRTKQKPNPNGGCTDVVEINEEVKIALRVKARHAIRAGDPVSLADIYDDDCFLEPPKEGDKPLAYFLWQRLFLDWVFYFDCSPNAPNAKLQDNLDARMKYPIRDIVVVERNNELVDPSSKLKLLSGHNWPPAPGYYPLTIQYLHDNPHGINSEGFSLAVQKSFNEKYWNQRVNFWRETNFFPGRLKYVEKAVEHHFAGESASSIYTLTPQFEGVIKQYLREKNVPPDKHFPDCVGQLRELVLSNRIILFPKSVLDLIFQHLEKGSFWKYSGSVRSPGESVNRHGILHGEFVGFESKLLSLKYLILLDSLGFVLLQHRLTTEIL